MPLKQSSILAKRYGLKTPENSKLSRRTIASKHKVSKTKTTKKQCASRVLRQLDFNTFLKLPENSKPSTPELIEEDQEIIEENLYNNFRFLKHVNSLELHYNMYPGYCSSREADSDSDTDSSSYQSRASSMHLL